MTTCSNAVGPWILLRMSRLKSEVDSRRRSKSTTFWSETKHGLNSCEISLKRSTDHDDRELALITSSSGFGKGIVVASRISAMREGLREWFSDRSLIRSSTLPTA